MFIAALCAIDRLWKKCKCPSTDEWTKKIWYTHTHTHTHTHRGILLSHKKNEILPFAITWTNLVLCLVNEADKEKHYCYHFLAESKN